MIKIINIIKFIKINNKKEKELIPPSVTRTLWLERG